MKLSGDLHIRNDDWSWQLMGPPESKLYIRVTSSRNDKVNMTFSDYIIHSAPSKLVEEALLLVRSNFRGPSSGMRLQFHDIMPTMQNHDLDKASLVVRHDQIVSSIRAFGFMQGFIVSESMIDIRNGRFGTTILIA